MLPFARLQRALLVTGATWLAFACGEKFTGLTPTGSAGGGGAPSSVAGKAGKAGAESDAGAPSDGGTGGATDSGGVAGLGAVGSSMAGAAVAAAGEGNGGEAGAPAEPPPIPLQGLQLWFRADDGVAQEADAVTWHDASGNGRDALQTAGNYKPKLVDDALAGKPALVFDGVDDFMSLSALGVDFSTGLSIFAVLRQESLANCDAYFEASTGSEMNDISFGDWESNYLYEVLEGTVHDTHYTALLHEPQIVAVIHGADGFARIRSNGNGVGEGELRLPEPVLRTQVFIGKTLYLNCGAFDGAISEMIVYNRGVNDRDLLQIERYLRNKWQCCGQ